MSNKISRTFVVVQGPLGFHLYITRWGVSAVESNPAKVREYVQVSQSSKDRIFRTFTDNPPSIHRMSCNNSMMALSYHYSCFYLDRNSRDELDRKQGINRHVQTYTRISQNLEA
jgi:hypothetical protein